jgi:sodium transport system ATP-binding protein
MIEANELVKRFSSPTGDVLAVDRVSFRVEPGEVFGLLGPNGAGKTTTLRMILGLVQPTSGYAEIDGFRTLDQADSVKARIGLVSANAGLYQWLTPRELLEFFADIYGVPPDAARKSITHLTDVFDLGSFLDRRCALLSAGQRQRVILARALVHDPPIMFLDEPTLGLDVVGCMAIFQYIRVLRDRGKSVIISTHSLDDAQRLCDRFGLINKGKLLHLGTLAQLQTETGCSTLFEMFAKMIVSERAQAEGAAA